MKYKEGDRVRIKSLDWYNENKNKYGRVPLIYSHGAKFNFLKEMSTFCGKEMTITEVDDYECKYYEMKEDSGDYHWTDEMIEGLVEEEVFIKANDIYNEEYSKGEYCHEQSFKWGFQEGYNYSHENDKLEISLKEGYQFKDENGNVINAKKIVLEKKKKEYPKTYEECLSILQIKGYDIIAYVPSWTEYEKTLYQQVLKLRELIICRDAYWKIAGEEMGLGKPWSPSDSDYITGRYCIFVHRGNIICDTPAQDCILTFPTEEMRDAFYENFMVLIEFCMELL